MAYNFHVLLTLQFAPCSVFLMLKSLKFHISNNRSLICCKDFGILKSFEVLLYLKLDPFLTQQPDLENLRRKSKVKKELELYCECNLAQKSK